MPFVDHFVGMLTPDHTSQRRISGVPRSRMPSRRMRSASARDTSGPMYVLPCSAVETSPSCRIAAGKCRPICGTSQRNTHGTEVRSVSKDATSFGTMKSAFEASSPYAI